MAKALLIAEKPSLMKEILAVYKKYGHKDIIVFKTFAGHTVTLQEPEDYKSEWGGRWALDTLPMIPDSFKYKPISNKVDMYKGLRDEIKNGDYDYLINACDTGREGQHIFFSFYEAIGCRLPVKRIWHKDYTEPELKRALDNLRDENEPSLKNMTIASKYRAYFDWLIGLNGTRAVSLVSKNTVRVGRVMTPVLKLIVDRELELKNFVPKNYWEIEGDFGIYKGLYFDKDNENETKFLDKSKAELKTKDFKGTAKIVSVEKKKETKYAPSLHSLQELSNEANAVFGYTMSETLAIAQSLYEKKILSYPRTDSSFLTSAIASDFKKPLRSVLSNPELEGLARKIMSDNALMQSVGKNKKYVDDSKVTDHYAIIPTGVDVDVFKLSDKERNIFNIVCRRLVSIFLPPMTSNKTTIITENNGNLFSTNGSVLINKGFMELYNYKSNDNMLPDVKKGETLQYAGSKLIAKKTSPPQRYNDKTLGSVMENAGRLVEDKELSDILKEAKGLGTPATRGAILDKLVALKMADRKGKSFYATDFGISIIESLKDKDITLPELTATWEQKLSKIEKGEYAPQSFYNEMLEYVKATISDFKTTNISVSNIGDKEVLGNCPACGKKVFVGKEYYMCEGYKKDCSFILPMTMLGAKISKTEVKKLISGKETTEFSFKKGENEWSAKLIYDKGTKKISYARKDGGAKGTGSVDSSPVCKCPKCGEAVKETEKYFLCTKYKDSCDFLISKSFSGAEITRADVLLLVNGKETEEKTFTWKSGSTGKARLKYTNRIDFVFNK